MLMRNLEERIGAVMVRRVEHDIDRDTVPELEGWAIEKLEMGERFLVLHCGRVQSFDSVGLELMLALTRAASSQGARFALAHLNADCSTTLRVTRLESAIEHYLTVEDAILAVQGRRA